MKSDFELTLEECLAQMRAGKILEECLSAHPADARKLRPLLEAARRVWEIPVPRARPAAVQAGRERLLAGANFQQESLAPVSSVRFSRYIKQILGVFKTFLLGKPRSVTSLAFRLGVAFVFVLLATSAITLKASASSLPGDKLYLVKRTWEDLRIKFTPGVQSKQLLQERYAEERREEVKKLMQLRRAETVEFQAPLEQMEPELWLVNGFEVNIDPETEMEGQPATGTVVDVRARLEQDGTLVAIQVRVPVGKSSTPQPPTLPKPTLTTPIQKSPEIESQKTPSYQQAPATTPQPPELQGEERNTATLQATEAPEVEATQAPEIHQTSTPESAEQHEYGESAEGAESHESIHPAEPTEQPEEAPEGGGDH